MNIVFCADYGVLPALHVAAYSALDRISPDIKPIFYIVSDIFNERDMALLAKTLDATEKPYSIELVRVDSTLFSGFNPLNGSLAAYYKLVIPQLIAADRYVYLDVDILCDVDLSPLELIQMEGIALAWVPEAPMQGAVDRKVAEDLGNRADDLYFNSGVLLVNSKEWECQQVTRRCLDYLTHNEALIREQSALNVIMYGKTHALDGHFNSLSNVRKNWPAMRADYGSINNLLHFVDYPKPWDLGAELVHPNYSLWRSVLKQTAMSDFKSWNKAPSRKFPKSKKSLVGYKKALKDRILFSGFKKGLLKNIKGTGPV